MARQRKEKPPAPEPAAVESKAVESKAVEWSHIAVLANEADLQLAHLQLTTSPVCYQNKWETVEYDPKKYSPKVSADADSDSWRESVQKLVEAEKDRARRLDRVYGHFIPEDAFGSLEELTPGLQKATEVELDYVKEFRSFQISRGREALRQYDALTDRISEARHYLNEDKPAIADRRYVDQVAKDLPQFEAERDAIPANDPDAYTAIYLRQLYSYINALNRGERIVPIPYVEEKKEEIHRALNQRNIAFVHGETGAGKTEVCRVIARERSGMDPIVLRGFPGMDSSEMFGHQSLTASSLEQARDIPERITTECAAFDTQHPDATKADRKIRHQQITQAVLSQSSVTVTEYVLGAVYLAVSTGRVLIIDEANYIPQSLMAKMNDILTKKPGEKIDVQEDGVGPLEIKRIEVLLTGNTDFDPVEKRYKGRVTLDPALIDRVPCIDYGYPPQVTEGTCGATAFKDKQQFVLALVTALSRQNVEQRGAEVTGVRRDLRANEPNTKPFPALPTAGDLGPLLLPVNIIDKLWNLSLYSAVIQGVASRKLGKDDSFSFQDGATPTAVKTDKVISMRALINVTECWVREGFSGSLDRKLYDIFIAPTPDPRQRAYFYQLANTHFGFFKSPEWQATPQRNYEDRIAGFVIRPPRYDFPDKKKLFTASEILGALWGPQPARKEFPTVNLEEEKKRSAHNKEAELVAALELFAGTLKAVADLAEEYPILADKLSEEKKLLLQLWRQPEKALQFFMNSKKITKEAILEALAVNAPAAGSPLHKLVTGAGWVSETLS